jgi:hypothetical protein
MQPRELPNLTVGNCPTMGPASGTRLGQQGYRWLLACSLGLLVAAGVTFTLVAQPTENKRKPAAVLVQPKSRQSRPEPPRVRSDLPAERLDTPQRPTE